MSPHWDVMLQCYCCCCCYCYNVSNNSCSSAIFWPISAYNQPKSIPAGQTYCIFSLFLYSLLLLVNVTLLWCEYCNATVTTYKLLSLYTNVVQCMYVLLCGMLQLVNITKKCCSHWVPMLLQYTTRLSMHFHMLQNGFIAAVW